MGSLQMGRDAMARAEAVICDRLASGTPGEQVSGITHDYKALSSDTERLAFVAVLAARLATRLGNPG